MLYCLKCYNFSVLTWSIGDRDCTALSRPILVLSRPLHARIMNIKQQMSARFLSYSRFGSVRFTGFCRKELNENSTFNLKCCAPHLHFAGDSTRSIGLCRVGSESLDRLRERERLSERAVNFRCIWLAQQRFWAISQWVRNKTCKKITGHRLQRGREIAHAKHSISR